MPQAILAGRAVAWPRGRTLGGSSSINAQVYLRGHRNDFDDWARLGCEGWGFDEVLPYFRRAERTDRREWSCDGVGGPLHVAHQRDPSPLTRCFVEACVETGIAYNDDLNGAEMDGWGTPLSPSGAGCDGAPRMPTSGRPGIVRT